MLAIIAFVIILGLLVLVHELGHFITARKCGVTCDEFGFGFPPRFLGVQRKVGGGWRWVWGARELTEADTKHGTVYSLNWIPLGGFVKIKGESGGDGHDKTSFVGRPVWQRALILVAGVVMNMVLAVVLLIIAFAIGVPQMSEDAAPAGTISSPRFIQVMSVNSKSPADRSDVKPGDVIMSIDGNVFGTVPEIQKYVGDKNSQVLYYQFRRGQDLITKGITPQALTGTSTAGIGIGIGEGSIVKYPWYLAIIYGIKSAGILLISVLLGFWDLLSGLFRGKMVEGGVAGPVGIASLTGQMATLGWAYLINFTAMLSVNLAVINILPIPALDGGRLLFLLIEKLRGKPIKETTEAMIHNSFFILLMLLIAAVTWGDISRLGCLTCRISSWFN